jgi:hypothetical protein
MKYNKAFAPIVLIVVIVGVLVIGGGAYYLGKKSNNIIKEEVKENLPNENQVAETTKTDCLPTTAPWIKVVSPNGGENYTTGQQIEVKWDSCNISKETQVFAQLAEGKTGEGEYSEGPGGVEGIAYYSLNDGSEIINLLPEMFGGLGELYYSKNYRIQITLSSNNKVFDYSDNFFAINQNIKEIINPTISFQYSKPADIIPEEKGISYDNLDSFMTKYVDPNHPAICVSTGKEPISKTLFTRQIGICPPGIVGCQSSISRVALICGDKYLLEDPWLSGPKFYGIFQLN